MPPAPEKAPGPRVLAHRILRSGLLHRELACVRLSLSPGRPHRRPALVFHVELLCACPPLPWESGTPGLQVRVTAESIGTPDYPAYREATPFIQLSGVAGALAKPKAQGLINLHKYVLSQRVLFENCLQLLSEGSRARSPARECVAAR